MCQNDFLINSNLNLFHIDATNFLKENLDLNNIIFNSKYESPIHNSNNKRNNFCLNYIKNNNNESCVLNNNQENKNHNLYFKDIYSTPINPRNIIKKEPSKAGPNILIQSLIKKSQNNVTEQKTKSSNQNKYNNYELIKLLISNEKVKNNFPVDYLDEAIFDICNELKENKNYDINQIQLRQIHFFLINFIINFFKLRKLYFNFLLKIFVASKLSESTLFLTFEIFDKFISLQKIDENEFLLVLITSFVIAVKYNEKGVANLDDIIKVCNNIFTKEQLLKCEIKIMNIINYNIMPSNVFELYQFISVAKNLDDKIYNFGLFLLEMIIIVGENLKYSPIIILESVFLLILETTNKIDHSLDLYKYIKCNLTNYKNEVFNCILDIKKECLAIKNRDMDELIIKFSKEKYCFISQDYGLI